MVGLCVFRGVPIWQLSEVDYATERAYRRGTALEQRGRQISARH
jgi:hypothetical protein